MVRAKLSQHGLTPSSAATKRVLVRRAYFDITGLPPTSSEVNQFLADTSDDAWENLIDRLLASPHFGERMAIYWLDLVRYADTVGYHGDQDVSVSPYRDYVINAFNANMPFDQFTREQLAGDLLPQPTRDQMTASGYNKLGMMSAEGGAQPKEYLAKYASDRVRTASTVWLGSTLGCAECHDHKFDPFTQKDFYRFASFFADIQERGLYSGANQDSNWGPTIRVPDDQFEQLVQPIDAKIARLTEAYASADLADSQQDWEVSLRSGGDWQVLQPAELTALHDTKLEVQDDQSVLASGPGGDTNTYTFKVKTELSSVTGFRVEVLPHDSLPQKGPGRAGNGNFVLSELRVATLDAEGNRGPLKFAKAAATFEQADGAGNPYKGWKAEAAIDEDVKGSTWGWAVLPQAGKANEIVAELDKPLQLDPAGGQHLAVQLEQNHKNPGHTIGRFRFSATSGEVRIDRLRGLPENIQKLVAVEQAGRSDEQLKELSAYYRTIAPELADVRKQLEQAKKERDAVQQKHTRLTLITKRVEPREMRVLPRGNWMDDSGEVVEPGVPAFLPQLQTEGRATRLDLAHWLTSRDNPLTARVFVNRLWKMCFGSGLSKVLDDIGSQGEFPSHPELLDELAMEFIDSGWNIKHMIKLIVTTDTYRQSSLMRDDLAEVDPYNRLLARQSRFRLDAELVRDNALAVSGLLVRELGGRSVKPYQPAGLLRHLNFPQRTYKQDAGSNQYRRGVYTHWQRQFLHPAMKSFDAPPREECTAERPRSNTPLAALVLLNDPSYVEAARVFAERVLQSDADSDEARIEYVFQEALSRSPNDEEMTILKSLIASQRKRYAAAPDSAKDLVTVGLRPLADGVDTIELASLMSVTRAVFNMHEFITRN